MFTYITIVKSLNEYFEERIYKICKNPNIEKVIIINKDKKIFNIREHVGKIMVLKMLKSPTNECWSMASFYAKSKYLIFSHDDLDFDLSIIDLVSHQIEDIKKLGILGVDNEIISDKLEELDYIYTEQIVDFNNKFDTLFFIKTKLMESVSIPNLLKENFGCNYLFNKLKDKGFINYVIKSDSFRIVDSRPIPNKEEISILSHDRYYWGVYNKEKKGNIC